MRRKHRRLDLVDLGKATRETKHLTISPLWFDGVSYQFYRPFLRK
jgi:hypothetical protein